MNDARMKIASHAYRTVPAYRKLLDKENGCVDDIGQKIKWEDLPLIEKSDAVMKPEQMISEEYLGFLVTGRLIRTHTSGSTGTYLDVYWEAAGYQKSLMPLWMDRWRAARIHPRDKVCFFNTVLENDEKYRIERNRFIVSKINMDSSRLKEIYFQIVEFSPKWLLLHPGIAAILCDMIEKEQLPPIPSVEYVELTGEMVFSDLKQRIERDFSCVVRCHYGTMEVSTIGYECGQYYQLYEDSTFVEVLDEEGNPVGEGENGNIYVTSLHNYAMPFVRYGIGDCGKIVTKVIKGKESSLLELTKARKNDFLSLPDGTRVPPDILLKPVEVINQAFENVVYQFQAKQISLKQVQLYIVLDDEFPAQEFIQYYNQILNEPWKDDMKFEYFFRENLLPESTTGKVCWFRNELRRYEGIKIC